MIPDWLAEDEALCHVNRQEPSEAEYADWPLWLTREQLSRIQPTIGRPWRHQVEAAELAHSGQHCVISTGTASGKTLAYLMPIINALEQPGRRATALYIAPTKALAHDQFRAAGQLLPRNVLLATLDGDSDQAERRLCQEQAKYILTNPDMLHFSVLPNHERWATVLRNLKFVVIDEAHRYRGVFGAHVAQVLRRLRRLCQQYGADPTFILASATARDAGIFGAKLIGEDAPIAVVDADRSPHGGRDIVLWKPKLTPTADAARVLAGLVDDGAQVITFVTSRNQSEIIAVKAAQLSVSKREIVSYRSGYLASERRDLEARLQTREIAGVAATNALELGVDISGMDAVVIVGMPGTLAALWQQAGRAGRDGREALVVIIAQDDPRDSYLFDHPELIFSEPVESVVLHPDNPAILIPHLAAAAQESALTRKDERWFGHELEHLADGLATAGLLRRRTTGWFWIRTERAVDAINLRSSDGKPLDIVEYSTGRVLGTVDLAAGDRTVHQGAVYLHQGEQWYVSEYQPDKRQALVQPASAAGFFTQALSVMEINILSTAKTRRFGKGIISFGELEVNSQVVGYLRRDEETTEVWDELPLELPVRTLRTSGVWIEIPQELLQSIGLSGTAIGASAHAAEHTAIGLLPLFAPCDRWDIGGLSTALHSETQTCTIFIYDGHPGGAGFAAEGYQKAEAWWQATLTRLTECPCEDGCPSCVVSPKCGNANRVLDKHAAQQLLGALLKPAN